MAGAIGGFTRAQCIEIANRRTEKRGESLDLKGEFLLALQEVCMETRWWWRRVTTTSALVAGTTQYDLTNSQGFNAADFHQAAKDAVTIYSVPGGPSGCNWRRRHLEPEFSPVEQDEILALQSQYPVGPPCRYFVRWPNLILDVIPNAAYPVSIGYWAIPNWTDDSGDETIPLVPNYAHNLIIKRLEMHIERFAVGEEANKYKVVAAEYETMVSDQQIYNRFADGQVTEIRNSVSGDAVQSS